MENHYVREMLGRQRLDEIHHLAERDRLVKQIEARDDERPIWKRMLAWAAGGAGGVLVEPGGNR